MFAFSSSSCAYTPRFGSSGGTSVTSAEALPEVPTRSCWPHRHCALLYLRRTKGALRLGRSMPQPGARAKVFSGTQATWPPPQCVRKLDCGDPSVGLTMILVFYMQNYAEETPFFQPLEKNCRQPNAETDDSMAFLF